MIAAVVVGGVAISGGRGTLVGTLLGVAAARHDRPGAGVPRRRAVVGEGDPGRDHPAGRRVRRARPAGEVGACRRRSTHRDRSPAPPAARAAQRILLALLALEVAVFAVIGTNFLTLGNAFEVVRLSVEIGLLALALTPVIVTGGIDLSVGSLMGLSAVAVRHALARRRPADRGWRRPLTLGVGALAGGLNGLLDHPAAACRR